MIDNDTAADLAAWTARHRPELVRPLPHRPGWHFTTTRDPAPDANAVCYPEIDPDEEPYGDTAAWRPRPSLLTLVTRAVTWKYRRIMKDMLNG